MPAELPSTEQIFTETSRLVTLKLEEILRILVSLRRNEHIVEGKTFLMQRKKIVRVFLHLVPPFPFSKRRHYKMH